MKLIPETIYHKIQYIGIKLMNIIPTFYKEINEILLEKNKVNANVIPTPTHMRRSTRSMP